MTQLTHFPDGIAGFEVAPDGARIVITHHVGGDENTQVSVLDPHNSDRIVPILVNPRVRFGSDRSAWQ